MSKPSAASAKRTTFSFQDDLPPLPVPDLHETCQKYLQTVKPLLTDTAFAQTQAAVADVQRPGGVGEQLHAALLAKAQTERNWLAAWWEEFAYLRVRDPVVINVNWAVAGFPPPHPRDPLPHAASLIARILEYKAQIDAETIEPQMLSPTEPLCMAQFARFFSTCRIPELEKDTLVTYAPGQAKHILVARSNQFYSVDVYDEQGHPYPLSISSANCAGLWNWPLTQQTSARPWAC